MVMSFRGFKIEKNKPILLEDQGLNKMSSSILVI